MRTMKKLCETLAEGALANYGRDGYLAPVIILLDREQRDVAKIIPQVEAETGGMPGAVYTICNTMVPLFDAHFVALLSETWVTRQDISDTRVPKRGELEQRAHAGDQTVETGLLVTGWDLVNLERSHSIAYWVDENYERHDTEGMGIGELSDAVRKMAEMCAVARTTRPPGKAPMVLVQIATDVLQEYVAVLMADPDAVES